MSETIRQEMLFFTSSIYTGILLALSYDMLRVLRKIIRHGKLAVNLEDMFYWMAAAFVICKMTYEKNHGEFRGYAFLGILLGVGSICLTEWIFRKIWIKLLKKRRKRGKMASQKMK
ncbi:MAG: spore cortex biosynthesis protein YabQ [Muricoprocola sp.]